MAQHANMLPPSPGRSRPRPDRARVFGRRSVAFAGAPAILGPREPSRAHRRLGRGARFGFGRAALVAAAAVVAAAMLLG
jgi:hypothetical protein